MCDYCEPLSIASGDYRVFEDMNDSWPIECCETMCYTRNHEVYLVRHAIDWFLVLVNIYDGTGDTVSVNACPVCGRELRGDAE